MKGAALVTVIAALGMRHGVDPDHLSVIDGLSHFHPSRWNGVYFALGHGIIVTLLAVGFGKLLAGIIAPYTVWILLALGFANLWRLWRPKQHKHPKPPRLFQASPLLLGVLFGMGFETASQLSAILLAGQLNPWILGAVFSLGMILVDGPDGFLAARTQQLAIIGHNRSIRSSRRWAYWLSLSPSGWLVENLPGSTSIGWPCRSASFSLHPCSFYAFGAAALDGTGPRPTTHECRVAEPDISVSGRFQRCTSP